MYYRKKKFVLACESRSLRSRVVFGDDFLIQWSLEVQYITRQRMGSFRVYYFRVFHLVCASVCACMYVCIRVCERAHEHTHMFMFKNVGWGEGVEIRG